jgi:succinyl-CoA synthetase alpha subunit
LRADGAQGSANGPRRRHHLRLVGTAEEKLAAFEAAGIGIMRRPADVVELLRKRM